jgi:hypothetical protein
MTNKQLIETKRKIQENCYWTLGNTRAVLAKTSAKLSLIVNWKIENVPSKLVNLAKDILSRMLKVPVCVFLMLARRYKKAMT